MAEAENNTITLANSVPTKVHEDGAKLEGECKWFHFTKGFGFLHNFAEGGEDVYVHHSDIVGFQCLVPGQKVQCIFKKTDLATEKPGNKSSGRATEVRAAGGGEIRNHGTLRNTTFKKRLESNLEIKLGYCKWFDPAKGYGFITTMEGTEVFAHNKSFSIVGDHNTKITQGMDVEYQLIKDEEQSKDGKEKLKAINVTAPGGLPIVPNGPVTAPLPYMQSTASILSLPGSVLGKRPAAGVTPLLRGYPSGYPGLGGLLGHVPQYQYSHNQFSSQRRKF